MSTALRSRELSRRQTREQSRGSGSKRRQIVIDRRLNDGVFRVEVAVGEVIAHTGDIDPRDVRCLAKQGRADSLYSFADLDEAYAYRVEDHAIVEATASQMIGYRVSSEQDVP